jgi:hypothetical protein
VSADSETPTTMRSDLGVIRTVMAADRPLMAWIRTSTSLPTSGSTIYKNSGGIPGSRERRHSRHHPTQHRRVSYTGRYRRAHCGYRRVLRDTPAATRFVSIADCATCVGNVNNHGILGRTLVSRYCRPGALMSCWKRPRSLKPMRSRCCGERGLMRRRCVYPACSISRTPWVHVPRAGMSIVGGAIGSRSPYHNSQIPSRLLSSRGDHHE